MLDRAGDCPLPLMTVIGQNAATFSMAAARPNRALT